MKLQNTENKNKQLGLENTRRKQIKKSSPTNKMVNEYKLSPNNSD